MAEYPDVLGVYKATIPLEYEDVYPCMSSNTVDGNMIRRSLPNQQYRIYTIHYDNVYQRTHDAIKQFYKDRLGGYESFDFTDPYTSTVYQVVFMDNGLHVTNIKNYIISFVVKIKTLPGQDLITN